MGNVAYGEKINVVWTKYDKSVSYVRRLEREEAERFKKSYKILQEIRD